MNSEIIFMQSKWEAWVWFTNLWPKKKKKKIIEEIYGDWYTININNNLYKTNATLIKTYYLTNYTQGLKSCFRNKILQLLSKPSAQNIILTTFRTHSM